MIATVSGYFLLALTVGLSLTRPKIGPVRIHHSTAAVIGAVLMIAVRILPMDQAVFALKLLARPVATIVSLMAITLMAEQAGFFGLIARAIAKKAGGSGPRLFAYLFFAGTLTGSIFTNDAAVLIFTPLVVDLIEETEGDSWTPEQKLPFYFSVLYIANIVGALVVSNPINIIVSSIFKIPFLEYSGWMLLPAIVSVAASFIGLKLFFSGSIPATYRIPQSKAPASGDKRFLVACVGVLILVLAGFSSESVTDVPVWIVSMAGAAALIACAAVLGRLEARPLIKGIGWDVIVFVVGMFMVSRGLREIGLTRQLGALLTHLAGPGLTSLSFTTGFVSAVCSAVMNNHPTADTMTWVIRDLALPPLDTKILALSALIGGDLGPKMLPIGSLAALLWFGILRKRGIQVPYSLYIRIGIPVTLAAVLISLAVLNFEFWCYRHLWLG